MSYMHIWVKKLKFCRWEFREIKKGGIFFLAKEDLEKLKKKKKKIHCHKADLKILNASTPPSFPWKRFCSDHRGL